MQRSVLTLAILGCACVRLNPSYDGEERGDGSGGASRTVTAESAAASDDDGDGDSDSQGPASSRGTEGLERHHGRRP